MPGLYDEYTASGAWSNFECVEGPNVTGQNDLEEVPWRKWIEPQSPVPTPYENLYFDSVGLFEGNISGYFGCYRPTAKSCYMGAGGFGEGFGQDLCPVCLQRFITMLYKYVDVIENPEPASNQLQINGNETINFSADIVKPEPNTQKYEWFLNGILLATGVESIEINFSACEQYVVDLVVTDTTEAVRFDEKFKDIYPEPKEKHTWNIEQSAVSDYNLAIETEILAADCSGSAKGEIQVEVTGGLAPYVYTLDGLTYQSSNMVNIEPGNHLLVVSDANGCSVITEVEIQQDPLLAFDLCSEMNEGNWELSVTMISEGNADLTYLWSTGSTEETIIIETPGTYNLEITDADGCSVKKEIIVSEIQEKLWVNSLLGNASENFNNGSIYLDIDGGLPPYEIAWYKSLLSDKTEPLDSRVFASDINPWTPKVYAFNNNLNPPEDFWAEEFTGSNYIGYDFENTTTIEAYSLISNVDTKERDAKSWTFQGSNDTNNWTVIDEINNFEFAERLEKATFALDEAVNFRFYRLLFTENWGSDRIVVQEFEFETYIGEELTQNKNKSEIQSLSPGHYSYSVTDSNQNCKKEIVEIVNLETPLDFSGINVSQDGYYKVKVEEPSSNTEYYWTDNKNGGGFLHVGSDFQPLSEGPYYVRAFDKDASSFVGEPKAFTVSMDSLPEVLVTNEQIQIQASLSNFDYIWYDVSTGGEPVHTGIDFVPGEDGYYYVVARKKHEIIESIDPVEIQGKTLWMDATDLDGNGEVDQGLTDSSAYSWKFREGGEWGTDSWFPYRSKYQNGNGVVDFSTMWFQYLTTSATQMRTVIMVYQESTFSFDKTAPLYGLNEHIPKHSDASQLFSDTTPATTLNGKTFLNGKLVDPLIEDNPMDFIILTVEFAELLDFSPFASDENWEGKLGELIVWDVALTDTQIQGVNEFLRKKWLSIADLESPRLEVSWGTDHVLDDDNDGVLNNRDLCPDTTAGSMVDANGCLSLSLDNFSIEVIGETCPDKNNGQLIIDAIETHNYIARFNETDYDFKTRLTLDNLSPGTYDLCITVAGDNYQQCYTITIVAGTIVSGKSTTDKNKTTIEITQGTAPFDVSVNGNAVLKTMSSTFELATKHGDIVEVKTDVLCEGVYEKTVQLFDIISIYPNPSDGIFQLAIPIDLEEVSIELYSNNAQLNSKNSYPVNNGLVQLDLRHISAGTYYIKVLVDEPVTLKIIKK